MIQAQCVAAPEGAEDKSPSEPGAGREYSAVSIALSNTPYAAMILLGTAVLALAPFPWAGVAAGAYVAYGLFGCLWIILSLCPYCPSYGRRSCPCGYGALAAKLRPQGDDSLFQQRFRKRIPPIVPLWILPVIIGGVAMVVAFSWLPALLMLAFVVDAFAVLPLLSKTHGCKHCPQREVCPWVNDRSVQEPGATCRSGD